MVGKELGNWVIRSLLGEGGMGAVFLVEQRFLGGRAAAKVLHGTYANHAEITKRFLQEAKATREILHPSVVKILDFGQAADGTLYLVMEHLRGETLASRVQRGRIVEVEARRIAAEVADAIAAAHDREIVHRDLKPDNVFLTDAGIKVLDFGIAKMTANKWTGTGAILGTPRYMAPEQAKAGKVGPQADIYALGVMLYEMVTGAVPFEGEGWDLITRVIMDLPPPPSQRASVSPELEALILRCLHKEPEQRPQTMREVAAALRDGAAAPVPVEETPTVRAPLAAPAEHVPDQPTVRAVAGPSASSPTATTPAPVATMLTPRPTRRSSRRRVVVAAAALCAGTVILTLLLVREPTQGAAPPIVTDLAVPAPLAAAKVDAATTPDALTPLDLASCDFETTASSMAPLGQPSQQRVPHLPEKLPKPNKKKPPVDTSVLD